MRYWWVNQNQTFTQEIEGGYLWSPKRNANGARNPFYEHMREVSPGDLVLSFQGTFIRAVGIACSFAYESPKPTEFQNAGTNWSSIGWRVDVSFSLLRHQIKPADHMERLRVELPRKYSPLRPNGHGLQSVYLTAIPQGMMHALADLIGQEVTHFVDGYVEETMSLTQIRNDGLAEWEEQLRERLEQDTAIDQTEKEQVILARRGQGRFKRNVGVSRLDGENGLLLTPSVDHLFDRGFISFEDTGQLLVSPVVHLESLRRMGVPGEGHKCGGFTAGQRKYLEFHRESVFLY